LPSRQRPLDPENRGTALAYDLARQSELKIRNQAALVAARAGRKRSKSVLYLTVFSTEVIVAADHQSFREKMLIITEASGRRSAISSYWREGKAIRIDLAPDRDVTAAIRESKVRNLAAARSTFQGSCRNDRRALA